jgi:hypothetical protein
VVIGSRKIRPLKSKEYCRTKTTGGATKEDDNQLAGALFQTNLWHGRVNSRIYQHILTQQT